MAENTTATVGLSKIVIPFFDPESQAVTPRAWLSFVEMARKSAGKRRVGEGADAREVPNWSDEVTCTNAAPDITILPIFILEADASN